MPTEKLFCYVDETGQDTLGAFFLVSVVLAPQRRESLRQTLEAIEQSSGKGNVKWHRTKRSARDAYIRGVLGIADLQSKLFYDIHTNTREYPIRTALSVARAVILAGKENCKAAVFVDGLRRSEYNWFGVELRRLGIRVDKVRGVRRDEADALQRLADALCGFVRAAQLGVPPFVGLLATAESLGTVRPVGLVRPVRP